MTHPSRSGLCPLNAPVWLMSTAVSQCTDKVSPEHVSVLHPRGLGWSLVFHAIQYFFFMTGQSHRSHHALMWPRSQFLVELSLCYEEYSRP